MKAAIIIFSDPNGGGEEALGRVFNGLASAYDFKQKGVEVSVYFQGTGTRWAGVITKADHPLNALYNAVSDTVAGVSSGCADVFGAAEDAKSCGFELVSENQVPGTSGLPSIAQLSSQGYSIFTY